MKVFHAMFMGPRQPALAAAREVPGWMLLSMGVLAALVIAGGLFPGWVVQHLAEPAVDAMLQPSRYIGGVLGGGMP
jgi:multicomponent Na+:H+ antiporter subunit D